MDDSEVARIAIRRAVLASAAVTTLIENRFYPSELGARKRVQFPCANFSVSGGSIDPDVERYKEPDLTLWAHSEESYDKAFEVYEAIKNVLHQELLTLSSRGIVCREQLRPIKAYEPVTEVFYLRAGWEIRMVNYG